MDQPWEHTIVSDDEDTVKLSLVYSPFLHTLEAIIFDEELNVKASSGDWFREESKGAGAIVKLDIAGKPYLLSCTIH